MAEDVRIAQHAYGASGLNPSHRYLWPKIREILQSRTPAGKRLLDLGCGNGAVSHLLFREGYDVTGVDPSDSGIAIARTAYPGIRFETGDGYEDLAGRLGRFQTAVCLEVIEHCYWPGRLLRTLHDALEPGGLLVLSTPYHGYAKNLALALAGKWGDHLQPLHDGGHIKFFDRDSLRLGLQQAGFGNIAFHRVGRIPPLAMSMIAVASR